MKKILILIFLLGLCFGSFCTPAFSQMLLQQGKVNLSLDPGETATGEVIIHNTKDQEISVKAYWQDFLYVPPFDGNKKFLSPGTSNRSCSNLVNFMPQEITLGPYGKKAVSYSARLPEDAEDGYYGVLFFEDNSRDKKTATGVTIVTRVGCLFFLEKNGASKDAKVLDIAIAGNQLLGTIENKSQIILIPRGIFYIMDDEGIVADRGEIEPFYLPPGESAPFFVDIANNIPGGNYTLILTFELGEGDSFVEEVDFEKTKNSTFKILQVRD
ncbi:MAG: hypothetical protein P9M07_02580 [Candidatus Aceula meridiana]|nr:hypothetical protein [Candidatus Aceula meridiana]